MSAIKIKQSLENLDNALNRLCEALEEPESNPLIVDGTIQRFEFVIEIMWKTLKRCLADGGTMTTSPKDTLKKSFAICWLKDETIWLKMMNDRNTTSHVYNEDIAKEIYHRVKNICYAEMLETYEVLVNKFFAACIAQGFVKSTHHYTTLWRKSGYKTV